MITITELKNKFDSILRLMRNANSMSSTRWRLVVIRETLRELRQLNEDLEKELEKGVLEDDDSV